MKILSGELQKEFGKGFSVDNLENMRRFYFAYPIAQMASAQLDTPAISETVSRKLQIPDFQLSWSHYLVLIRIADIAERRFYEIEAAKNQWSLRELQRQFESALYLRLALSTDKEGIKTLAAKGQIIETAKDAVKDPMF